MANIEADWALGTLQTLRRQLARRGRSAEPDAGESLERSIEGFQLYEQGRFEEARVAFRKLCGQQPRHPLHRAALGLVYLAMDALSEAERELTRSIQLSAREPSAFVTRGEVYLRLGRYADAAKDFDSVVKLIPEQTDPLARRARLLASTAREMMGTVRRKPVRARKAPSRRVGTSRRK